MNIEKEIRKIVADKKGSKEVAVFFDPFSNEWCVSLGNPSSSVMLGEVEGEIESTGLTLEGAITSIKDQINHYNAQHRAANTLRADMKATMIAGGK